MAFSGAWSSGEVYPRRVETGADPAARAYPQRGQLAPGKGTPGISHDRFAKELSPLSRKFKISPQNSNSGSVYRILVNARPRTGINTKYCMNVVSLNPVRQTCHYPHFTDDETEAKRNALVWAFPEGELEMRT